MIVCLAVMEGGPRRSGALRLMSCQFTEDTKRPEPAVCCWVLKPFHDGKGNGGCILICQIRDGNGWVCRWEHVKYSIIIWGKSKIYEVESARAEGVCPCVDHAFSLLPLLLLLHYFILTFSLFHSIFMPLLGEDRMVDRAGNKASLTGCATKIARLYKRPSDIFFWMFTLSGCAVGESSILFSQWNRKL